MNILDKLKSILLLSLSIFWLSSASQIQLSDQAEISLITCGPGSELYSAFGHTAIRVHDLKNKIDLIYNYGTFDFDDPNFYPNFAKGNLEYFLSSYDFGRFLRSYHKEKRWVKGQVFNLDQEDTQAIFEFLEINALPENKVYLYDYFFDNCSTKPLDVLYEVLGDKITTPTIFDDKVNTHRGLIQPYVTNLPWGDFGIDLGLGSVIDRKVTPKEFLFLPENVLDYMNEVNIVKSDTSEPLVKRVENILLEQEQPIAKPFLTPFLFFNLIVLLAIFITWRNIKNKTLGKGFDFSLFFITGLIGLVVLLIWFATNHISSKYNFNALWAFAPNLLVAFVLFKNKRPQWLKKYALLCLSLLILLIIFWIFKIQVYSIAILPLTIALGIRYFFLWKLAK
ncbi:DUF4105 domain-containing protein [Urechidicola sp. KH5]